MMSSGHSPNKFQRLQGLVADEDEQGGGMDEATRQALSECQKELDELNKGASKEVLPTKNKYNKLRKPLYEKRAAVIDEIPKFWADAIVNHPQISMLVNEEEEDCLHFLKKLEVEEFGNVENGFWVKFVFDENPYFDNTELVKTIQLGPNTEPKSTSTGIKWKEQMDLSKKQPQNIDARRKRGLKQKTFFSWFSDNNDPEADDIAEVIKDYIWPNPLKYYKRCDREVVRKPPSGLRRDFGSPIDLGENFNGHLIDNHDAEMENGNNENLGPIVTVQRSTPKFRETRNKTRTTPRKTSPKQYKEPSISPEEKNKGKMTRAKNKSPKKRPSILLSPERSGASCATYFHPPSPISASNSITGDSPVRTGAGPSLLCPVPSLDTPQMFQVILNRLDENRMDQNRVNQSILNKLDELNSTFKIVADNLQNKRK